MTPLTPPPSPTEGIEEAKARARQLSTAFFDVFGSEGGRTANQRMVMEHLEKCSGGPGNAFQFTAGADGMALALSAAHRDGARSQILVINRQLSLAVKTTDEPKKAKPRTKR